MNLAVNQAALPPCVEAHADPTWAHTALSQRHATESRASWARELVQALASLSADERSYIRLSYIDGLHHDQIAARVGIPVSAVSRAIALGMQRLAPLLERA